VLIGTTVTVSPTCVYDKPELQSNAESAVRAGYFPSRPDVTNDPIDFAAKATGVLACLENSSKALSSRCDLMWNTTSWSRSFAIVGGMIASESTSATRRRRFAFSADRSDLSSIPNPLHRHTASAGGFDF